VFNLGLTDRACPLQASNADLWAIIQSSLPSRCTVAKEVRGDFVDIRAVIGEVDDICAEIQS
jgi:hypothetical protein